MLIRLAYRSAYGKKFLQMSLSMKREAANIVSKLLNLEQKQRRMDIASYWLKKVITGDELWVYGYDIRAKAQSAKTEKSMSSSVKCEGFAGCFFRLQRRGAL